MSIQKTTFKEKINNLKTKFNFLLDYSKILFMPGLASLLYLRWNIEVKPIAFYVDYQGNPLDLRIVYANRMFQELTGYSFKEIKNRPIAYYVDPDWLKETIKEVVDLSNEKDVVAVRKFENVWIHGETKKPMKLIWVFAGHRGRYFCEITSATNEKNETIYEL